MTFRRLLLFTGGVVLIAVPTGVLLYMIATVVIRVVGELQQYRGLFVTVDVSLDETTALIAVLGLAVVGIMAGIRLLREARGEQTKSPLSIKLQ